MPYTLGLVVLAILCALAWVGIVLLGQVASVRLPSFVSITMLTTLSLIFSVVALARSPMNTRRILSDRLVVGLWAGLAATVLQDVVQLLLYFAGLQEFSLIREAMLSIPSPSASWNILVIFMGHYIFFLTIGMIYAVMAGKARWFYGLAWILALQAYDWGYQLATYRTFYLTFTVLGYIAYGTGLGVLVQKLARDKYV